MPEVEEQGGTRFHQAPDGSVTQYAIVAYVDANGTVQPVYTGPAGGGTGAPTIVRLEDGLSTALATVAQFHNADNQSPGATAYGLLTGGVAQLLNAAGNIDRQRETGTDGVSPVGVATGSAQFAMAFLTTDSTDNFAAGTRTFTPAAMSGSVLGVSWSILAGSVLTLDSGANAETVVVTAVTSTTFTCVTTKAHNGTVTPFSIAGFIYNQERDAAGELDGATGSGTAVAAEYEFNGGGAGNSNFDRARNLQGKGLSTGVSWTGTLTATTTSFTAASAPTGLQPGQPIFFYNTTTGAITEVAYTALNYAAGSTSIVLKVGLVNSHNSASESFRYDTYAAAGPGTNGFLPTGIGIEEEALYDPVSGLFYIERAATQDAMPAQNIVAECDALWNGTNFDRPRAASSNPTAATGVEVCATGLAGLTSLSGVSGTGAGTALDGGVCHANHTMVVTSGAGVSAGSVQLQGSLDGTNWFNLGTAVSTNAASTTFAPVVVSNQPVRQLRANVTTAITGGTISAVVGMA